MQSQNKQDLRKIYREKRLSLSPAQFQTLNHELLDQVQKVDFSAFSTVHLFLPIQGNREPDTYAIAEWLRQHHKHPQLVLSRTNPTLRRMEHVIWDETTLLKENKWGIPEPQNGTPIPSLAIDAVLVPLLAFDIHGNRVGYGKGFYDRFLAECPPTTVKIGLSLFDAGPAIADVDPFDIALDQCITPHRIWHFNTAP